MSPTPWQWIDGRDSILNAPTSQGRCVAAGAVFQATISTREGRVHWSLWTGGTVVGEGPALSVEGGKIAVAMALAEFLVCEAKRVGGGE